MKNHDDQEYKESQNIGRIADSSFICLPLRHGQRLAEAVSLCWEHRQSDVKPSNNHCNTSKVISEVASSLYEHVYVFD